MTNFETLSDADLREQYLHFTKYALPTEAKLKNWPITADHCFQRVVLDTVTDGVWYDHIPAPAIHNMTRGHLLDAATLCVELLDGTKDIHGLNAKSIAARRARNTSAPCPSEPRQKMLDL